MAKLINGNGNKAIWAAQDADMIASICGNITSIAAVGSQFSYTQEDANTIGVADGVIITKEGRRIQLDTGSVDLFTIPTGVLGETSYYIIGYHLIQNLDTTQVCETFVQKMDNSTDVIPEDTFKGGATEVYVSLYRVTQDGMNIDTIDLLLPELSNVAQLINNLIANSKEYQASYQNGKYGFTIDGTFYPLGGGGSPSLDYSNPITITNNYTATENIWICGYVGVYANGSGSGSLAINGSQIAASQYLGSYPGTANPCYSSIYVPLFKISAGDIVTISGSVGLKGFKEL